MNSSQIFLQTLIIFFTKPDNFLQTPKPYKFPMTLTNCVVENPMQNLVAQNKPTK